MSAPYLGEIQLFGFNFNPRGWAFCNGATLPIQQNTALFSLITTTFGGNGTTTFQLPNFAGRTACGQGTGSGLSPRTAGETFGVNAVTLGATQMPSHSHTLNSYTQPDASKRQNAPTSGSALTGASVSTTAVFAPPPGNTTLLATMLAPSTGGGLPHGNQQPYLGINYCIALSGIYPSFS